LLIWSTDKERYFLEPLKWNIDNTVELVKVTAVLAGTAGSIVIDPEGNLIEEIPPGPSFEGI